MLNSRRISSLLICCWLAASSALTACGGGGGSPAVSPPPPPLPPPPPPTKQGMGGFWAGVLTFDMTQTSEIFLGVVTEDGRFHFLSAETLTQFVGTQQFDMTRVMGSGLGYADAGSTWLDNSQVVNVTTDATLLEGDNFTGIWSTASGESGNFDLFYSDEYERPSVLSLLEGVWTALDEFGNTVATFTVDNSGLFSGQNVSGCMSNGLFSIIDDRYNVYQVDSTIANCSIAGDYSGIAMLGDDDVSNDVIVLSVNNNSRAIVLYLEK